MTVERVNYKVNNWAIAGTVVFTNQTTDAAIPTWLRTVDNMEFISPVGLAYTSTGNRTVRQVGGVGSTEIENNIYEIIRYTYLD